jgi:hypothetical protein
MPKPTAKWSEEDVLALPRGENDTFERKGAEKLDLTLPGVQESEVLNELAKQLSAFANAGGGRIIYGLTDEGAVENGGIARSVKGQQPTKDWLEDLIPVLTEFEIVGFNVYEISPTATGSTIDAKKSLYIVDVPDSDRAPHQSKRDLKYYVRLGGKSVPVGHRLIEDIRNRQKHPSLNLASITLEVIGLPDFRDGDPPTFAGRVYVRFNVRLKNIGRIMAKSACIRVALPEGARWENYDNKTIHRRGEEWYLELEDPVYPGMEIGFWIDESMPAVVPPPRAEAIWGGPWLIARKQLSDVRCHWQLFADNAPTKEGSFTLEDLGFREAAGRTLDKHPEGAKIRNVYDFL